MTDQTPPPENGGNGARKVSNWELILLAEKIDRKIDGISTQMAIANTAAAKQGVQVETNTKEIAGLREHYHQIATAVTPLIAILSVDVARELAYLLPYVRDAKAMTERRGLQDVMTPDELAWVVAGAKELPQDTVKRLAKDAAERARREARWFGMSREVLLIGIGGVIVLLNSPTVAELWHALAGH